MNTRDFTRYRKQSFAGTLLLLINLLRKSLCIEIVSFVDYLTKELHQVNLGYFTKSAFVQSRKKISPEVFNHLSCLLVNEFYEDNLWVKRFKGYRLLAVDSSVINLPKKVGLETIYGKSQRQAGDYLVQGRLSILYDVLNRFAIDSSLAPVNTGERKMALSHLEAIKQTDLIIYDRGYPSYDFIDCHHKKSLHYLMRVRSDYSNVVKSFVQTGQQDQLVEIYPKHDADCTNKSYTRQTPITIRLIRVELDNGQMEYLMTSLLNTNEYPVEIFKELYFQRWAIETFFDELKNKLKMEYFSGYSNQCILQDFYATIFISNIQSLIVNELEEELDKQPSNKKYRYKVNTSLSYGFIKNRIISLFFFENKKTEDIVAELKSLFCKHLIPIRPNRSNKRNKYRYKKRVRPKVSKNQKDAI